MSEIRGASSPHPAGTGKRGAALPRATRITVQLLFAAWTVDFIDRLVVNLTLPDLGRDFHLNHAQQGLIVSVFFIAYALGQLPGGLLADRHGALRIACLGLLAWSLFTGLTALAWSFLALLAIRFLFGLAQGVFPAAATKALTERTVPEQRMAATGWSQSSSALGALLAALIAAVMLPSVGWRAMFVAVTVLGLLCAYALRRWLPAPLSVEANPTAAPTATGAARAVLRSGAVWGFAAAFFGYDVVVFGLNTWVPSYLHTQRGVTLGHAGLLSFIPTVAAAIAVVAGGKLADRLGDRPRRIVVPAMAVTAALLVALPRTGTVTGFVAVLTAVSALGGLCFMQVFAVPLRALPTGYVGTASAVIIFGGQTAGVLAPYAVGLIVDHASWTRAFEALAVGPLIAAVAISLVPQTVPALQCRLRAGRPTPPAQAVTVRTKQANLV